MSPQTLNLILHLILAALYLPVLANLVQRRSGHETAATLLSIYVVLGMLLTIGEGLWRGGQLQLATSRVANDFQLYGATALAFLLALTVAAFTRRNLRRWFALSAVWVLGFVVILLNALRLPAVIWTNGRLALTLERLAPTWAIIGWLIFIVGAIFIARAAHARSRQPLFRNRLNYWTPVFLLTVINDVLIILGLPLPGNPVRLGAVALAALIIITHDPPDLREVARRVLTYIITTIVIVVFYVAGFSASQTVFKALPNFNPLLVGAGIALLLSFIFTPLLSLVQRWVNRLLNIHEFHASRTLHAYSEQISNILDMQKLANVAVGLIIEAMDITRGFLFLVDSELSDRKSVV